MVSHPFQYSTFQTDLRFIDWTPNPQGNSGSAVGVSMLWGGGTSGDPVDAIRLAEFWAMGATWLPYVMGFEEPDCSTSGSANMDVGSGMSLPLCRV